MNLRPVIERELRTAARQLTTYYSRLVPGILLLSFAAFVYFESRRYSTASQVGSIMFSVLNATLFTLIWLIVPLTTADVISREKREDTLGLLLLTPLRPFEIVISKMLGGLFRGSTLILAVIPIIAVPMLLGGITPMDLVRIAFLNLSALVGATAAGVVTSSFCERRGRAWFVSFVVAALSFSVLYSLHAVLLLSGRWGNPTGRNVFGNLMEELWFLPVVGWISSSGILDFWRNVGSPSNAVNVGIAGCVLILAILFSGLGVFYAARRIRRFADERNLSARQRKLADVFTKERIFARQLSANRRRLLTRNPSAWLVQRKWTARLAKWGWTCLVIVVLTFSLTAPGFAFEGVALGSLWLGLFIVLTVMLLSATSLQSERDSGALELVLVTHLSPQQLVNGRLSGIWKTFQPSVITLIGLFCYSGWIEMSLGRNYYGRGFLTWLPYVLSVMFLVTMMRWMPVIGLCFSLNRGGVLSAVINTFFFGFVIPWIAPISIFGLAMFFYGGIHNNFHNSFPYLTLLIVFVGGVILFQFSIWFARRKGKLKYFPKLFPAWFTKWKLDWFGPWLLVGGCLAGMEALTTLTVGLPFDDDWMVLVWHIVSWCLLAFFARQCRQSLYDMLETRTFVTEN